MVGRTKNIGRLKSLSTIERVGETMSCAAGIRSYGPVNTECGRECHAFHRTHMEAREGGWHKH